MGRNKVEMKKIEDPISRQQFYSKRKDSIVKKTNELAVLCEADVALLLFSPDGQMTSYSSKESVEDIMLLVMNQRPILDPNKQHLMQSLIQSKNEGEMIKKIAIVEDHEKKLNKLKQTLSEAQQKKRNYEPQMESINSVQEADAYAKFLMDAMELIQQSKAKLLDGHEFMQKNKNVAVASINI